MNQCFASSVPPFQTLCTIKNFFIFCSIDQYFTKFVPFEKMPISKMYKDRKEKIRHVKEATIRLLKNETLCTITPDRGKEFSLHTEITE